MEVERKYDPYFTRSFELGLSRAGLNEYEKKVFKASIEYFCSSLDKKFYNPIEVSENIIFYDFEIAVFQRKFRVIFEVDGIDAYALDFREV